MLQVLSQFVSTELYIPFAQTMVDAIPNCLYGNVPKEELEKNLSTPNLKSGEQKPGVVKKVLNKERSNHLALAFTGSFARFTTNIGINKLRCSFTTATTAQKGQAVPSLFKSNSGRKASS